MYGERGITRRYDTQHTAQHHIQHNSIERTSRDRAQLHTSSSLILSAPLVRLSCVGDCWDIIEPDLLRPYDDESRTPRRERCWWCDAHCCVAGVVLMSLILDRW